MVHQAPGCVARWKCPRCKTTFTDYPDFALPYKRFVPSPILEVSERYVNDDESTYRKAVRKDGRPVAYAGEEGEEEGRQLSHTSLWRWVGWLGRKMSRLVREAMKLIRQKDPTTRLHRESYPVPARKYQSKTRRKVLQECRRLFAVKAAFESLFGPSLFTDFGTGYEPG